MSEVSKIGVWFWSIVAVGVPAAWIGAIVVAPIFSDRVVEVDDAVRDEIAAGLGIADMHEDTTNGAGRLAYEGEFIVLRTTVDRQTEAMTRAGWVRTSPYVTLSSARLETTAFIEPLQEFIRANEGDIHGHGRAAEKFAKSIGDPEDHVVVTLAAQ
ncbi:hypothetical protein [Herbidospora daliensis]|uniref:hypothetical protein n=1 Tax=Herbidospora daliensis TaxID=295585 RepID=UPI0007831899|nr:hypothetical protein [Herbidospora daliensis]